MQYAPARTVLIKSSHTQNTEREGADGERERGVRKEEGETGRERERWRGREEGVREGEME